MDKNTHWILDNVLEVPSNNKSKRDNNFKYINEID